MTDDDLNRPWRALAWLIPAALLFWLIMAVALVWSWA